MFCSKCGYKNSNNARFCVRCGTELGSSDKKIINPDIQKPMNIEMKKSKPVFLWIGIAIVLIAAVVVITVVIFSKGSVKDRYNGKMDLGQKYLFELDYEQAILCFEEAIEIDPKNKEAYLLLAETYVKIGKPKKALEVLKTAEDEIEDANDKKNVKEKKLEIEEKYTNPQDESAIIKNPDVTAAPVVTEMPDVTAAPVVTEMPDVTAAPAVTESPVVTAAPYTLKTDDTFWDSVTDYSSFEPGIYDRFGNMFFSFTDYWEYVTADVKYKGEMYTVWSCNDWDNDVMDEIGWDNEKWVSDIKRIYNLDVSDDRTLMEWYDEYYKDCVVIVPEVWGIYKFARNYRCKWVKTVVLPKSLKILLETFSESSSLENIIVPSSVKLLCFDTREKTDVLRECPKITQSSRNALENLWLFAESHRSDDVWDYLEFVRYPAQYYNHAESVIVTPVPIDTETIDFEKAAQKADTMISKAVAQYTNEDYTGLSEAVKYNILWLGYTHVTFGELDFRMTEFDKEYLKAVTENLEKTIERITSNNVDISIDLHFITEERKLTKSDGEDWLYLSQETVQSDIDQFDLNGKYDSILTTVQSDGDGNKERNSGKSGYGEHDIILGLTTAGLEDGIGYSTFNLGIPKDGTYPLANPEIPSLYATAVAVHEWMHQLEYLGEYLGIEYPSTHAYIGEDAFGGYGKYIADQNNYDFFEFYELVLQGKLPYYGFGYLKHVGMYPEMWPLTKRGAICYELGTFTIRNFKGEYLYADGIEQRLTLSKDRCLWRIYFGKQGRFILIADAYPDLRIDLNQAWDIEENTVKIFHYTGYDDAQSWRITKNIDGSYCLRTPYSSGRAITVNSIGSEAYISSTGSYPKNIQSWIITKE